MENRAQKGCLKKRFYFSYLSQCGSGSDYGCGGGGGCCCCNFYILCLFSRDYKYMLSWKSRIFIRVTLSIPFCLLLSFQLPHGEDTFNASLIDLFVFPFNRLQKFALHNMIS
jgi:hypothetical protein